MVYDSFNLTIVVFIKVGDVLSKPTTLCKHLAAVFSYSVNYSLNLGGKSIYYPAARNNSGINSVNGTA